MTACGNPECKCSTGIHEELTFGSGKLDDFGYFQFPCAICAREWDRQRPEHLKKCLADEQERNRSLTPNQIFQFVQQSHEWLFLEAWPRSDQDVNQLIADFRDHYDTH